MSDFSSNPEWDHVVRGEIKGITEDLVVAEIEIHGTCLPVELVPASAFREAGFDVTDRFLWRINDIDNVVASELRRPIMELSEEDKRFCKVVKSGEVAGHCYYLDDEFVFYKFEVDGKEYEQTNDLYIAHGLKIEEDDRVLVKYMLVDSGNLMISEIVEKLPDIEITDEEARRIKEEIEALLPYDPDVIY